MSAPNFELRISQRRALDAKIDEIKKGHKEQLKPYVEALEKLDNVILDMLIQTNQQNANTPAGTAYKRIKESVSLESPEDFRRHVIGTESWDMLDWKANVTAVKDFVKENDALPPGVKFSSKWELGVLAPRKPKNDRLTPETVNALAAE